MSKHIFRDLDKLNIYLKFNLDYTDYSHTIRLTCHGFALEHRS